MNSHDTPPTSVRARIWRRESQLPSAVVPILLTVVGGLWFIIGVIFLFRIIRRWIRRRGTDQTSHSSTRQGLDAASQRSSFEGGSESNGPIRLPPTPNPTQRPPSNIFSSSRDSILPLHIPLSPTPFHPRSLTPGPNDRSDNERSPFFVGWRGSLPVISAPSPIPRSPIHAPARQSVADTPNGFINSGVSISSNLTRSSTSSQSPEALQTIIEAHPDIAVHPRRPFDMDSRTSMVSDSPISLYSRESWAASDQYLPENDQIPMRSSVNAIVVAGDSPRSSYAVASSNAFDTSQVSTTPSESSHTVRALPIIPSAPPPPPMPSVPTDQNTMSLGGSSGVGLADIIEALAGTSYPTHTRSRSNSDRTYTSILPSYHSESSGRASNGAYGNPPDYGSARSSRRIQDEPPSYHSDSEETEDSTVQRH
ncbi:hypothetical protein VNI00_011598 [Paramarasmius palmivorus]|uniref:Uncharacterized protein n=1 Tax=Paramarasmius palmivorus TaxID=297713 RepID=A0AAW0CDD8_9AGAR